MKEETVRKESAYDLNYIKVWKTFSMSLGGWPRENGDKEGNKFQLAYRRFLPMFGVFIMTCTAIHVIEQYGESDFMERGHLYITMFSAVVTTVRVIVPNIKNYHQVAQRYFNEFHLIHFKHKSEFHLQVNNTVDKISYITSLYFFTITIISAVVYHLPAIYLNYKIGVLTDHRVENSTLQFSILHSVPGLDTEKMLIPYTLLNVFLGYAGGGFHCLLDLYLTLLLFQIMGHIHILKHDLASIPKPKTVTSIEVSDVPVFVDMYNAEENRQVYKSIKECIRHHLLIVSFTDDVSTLFGPTIAISYLFHLVGCCVCLLQIFSGDFQAIIHYGVYTIGIFGQLLYISIIFEILTAKSEKLIDAVYEVPWECMDVPNRRVVLMLLRRVQNPVRVTALGLADVGVGTMVGILKATFSYYTFFSSFK